MVYRAENVVVASQCNANANLSVLGLVQIVQDVLTQMMKKLKIDGISAVKNYGAMWVFSKSKTQILGKLGWGDKYVAESFFSSKSLAKMTIDTAIKNTRGKIVAYSRTEICPLDVDTMKIRKVDTVGVDEKTKIHNPLVDIAFSKLQFESLQHTGNAKVGSTSIDYCHHCNNVEYLRFVLNMIPCKELSQNPPKQIELAFLGQSFEGDNLEVFSSNDGNAKCFEIRLDQKAILRCKIN